MSLHLPTIAFMATLVGLELALGFLLVGWALGRQRGLGPWILGAACLSLGGLSWGLRGSVPELLLILFGNGMQFVGFGLLWAGCRDFCGRPRSLLPIALGALAFLAGLLWFSTGVPSTRARVIVFCLGIAPWSLAIVLGAMAFSAGLLWFSTGVPSTRARVIVFCLGIAPWSLAIATTFFRHAPADLRTSARIPGAAFLLHGLFLLVRIFLPQEGTSPIDLLRPGWPQTAAFLEVYVSSIGTMPALVVLLAHRLVNDFAQAARTDPLTGVLNRRALSEEGEKALALCRGMQLPCTVLLLDLDHFKAINDTWGHMAGDAALRQFAQRVGPLLRRSDVFGRYGGEEFLAVLPGTNVAEAQAAAERVRRLVEEHPVVLDGANFPLTVSIGVSSGETESLDELVLRADAALYRAKSGGRNRVIHAAA